MSQETSNIAPAQGSAHTRLHGRALKLAHRTWWLVVGASIALTLVALPPNLEFYHEICSAPPCLGQQLTAEQMRNLLALGLTPGFYAAYNIALGLISMGAFMLVGLIIFLRKQDDRFALFTSLTLVIFGAATAPSMLDVLSKVNPVWSFPTQVLRYIGSVAIIAFLYIFPNGQFVPRWTRFAIVLLAVQQLTDVFLKGTVVQLSDLVEFAFSAAFVASVIFAQLYRYRRVSNATERQQTKWVVFGVTGALGSLLTLSALDFFLSPPADNMVVFLLVSTLYTVLIMVIPISIGIAILLAHLWDIDLLINRTLVYVPLTAILAGIFGATITLSQKLFIALTGQTSDVATVLTTLIVVAAVEPIKENLQKLVDKRFKETPDPGRELRAIDERALALLEIIDVEVSPRRVLEAAVRALNATGGAVYMLRDGQAQLVSTAGEWYEQTSLALPIEDRGAHLGVLKLGPRNDGSAYDEAQIKQLQGTLQRVARAISLVERANRVRE